MGLATAIFLTLAGQLAHAQEQTTPQTQEIIDIRQSMMYRMQRGIYHRAIKYGDIYAASNALYNLCVMDPQNDSLLFMLGYLYFDNQKYLSATLTLTDVLMLNPDNIDALEMKALSLEQIGAFDKSLEDFESLYLKTNSITYLYKVTIFQFRLKRYKEAKTNIDILLSKKDADELKIYIPGENDEQQEVLMRASLHNLKGLIAKEEGNATEAKKQFGIALEVQSDFYMAKVNLDEISSQ
jgi:tetratricopeptide (TPR) repeat protein